MKLALTVVAMMLAMLGAPTSIRADTPHPIVAMFRALAAPDVAPGRAPRFVFGPERAVTADLEGAAGQFSQYELRVRTPVVGVARDGKAAWLATEVDVWMPLTSDADDVPGRKADGFLHASALVDGGPAWSWVTWHAGWTALRTSPRPRWRKTPAAIARQVPEAAEPVVTEALKALTDPARLAAMIDDRDDAVLLGSDRGERIIGAKAVRSTVHRWKLAFTVRDGVQAGLTSSGTVAWLAANVDARPARTPQSRPTAYRASLILERGAAGWKIVVAQFSRTVAD